MLQVISNRPSGLAHPAQPDNEDPLVFYERPERLDMFRIALDPYQLPEQEAQPVEERLLTLVHPAQYVEAFKAAVAAAGEQKKLVPFGKEFFVGEHSFTAARTAVGAAVEAVDLIHSREAGHIVCVVRPPGHHAMPEEAMGFCGFNSAAVAALYARELGHKVALVDYDVHCGNGTIAAVGDRPDLYFAEIRIRGEREYPCSDSYQYEQTVGNLVLIDRSFGTTGDEYFDLFDNKILKAVHKFKPDMIIISACFDSMMGDPIGDLGVEPRHIQSMVHKLAKLAPTITLTEGGYELENLILGLNAHVAGLQQALQHWDAEQVAQWLETSKLLAADPKIAPQDCR